MNSGHSAEQIERFGDDPLELLRVAPAHTPGTHFAYNSPATHALSAIVTAFSNRESVGWPPRSAVPNPVLAHLALGTPVVWALVVATVFWEQNEWPGWLENWGALEPQALFVGGECWRPLTALFLHADLLHLW